MSGIVIRKGAEGDTVSVIYDGHITNIPLDGVSKYDGNQYLCALIKWALDGYKGFPPVLRK